MANTSPNVFSRLLSLVAVTLTLGVNATATTVVAPEFDALVQQADCVVRGTVKSVAAQWREQNGHRNIVTLVEINVIEKIAGTPPTPLVLQMLGGKIGDQQLIVQGTPSFTVGGEYILFIRGNGVQFNPLVALMHGQYPIKKDAAGRAAVTRSDGTPLHDEKDVSLPMDAHAHSPLTAETPGTVATQPVTAAAETPALSSAEFAARIRVSRLKSASAP